MSYKSIVTFVLDHAADGNVVGTAAAIAETNAGHLSAICLGVDRTQPGAYYAGANALALQHSLAEAQEAATDNEESVRKMLGVWQVPWETLGVTVQIGAIGSVIADHAHLADLIVLPKPYGPDRGAEDVVVTESALFGTDAPVLVVPEGYSGPVEPKKVVIAWNQSREALAAIRAALPYLVAAREVNVAIIDPPSHRPDRSDPGGALAAMLTRHGVRTDVSVIAKTMPRVSDVIARHCGDQSADLLVMGAYGHSRLREAILGGATRNTLEHAEIPVLMAH